MERADEAAFDTFARARLGALLRFAHVLTGDPHQAADLVQDALERTLLAWPRVIGKDDPEAYVRRAIVNRHVSVWRRRRLERLVADTPDAAPYEPASHDGVLWAELRALPPRQRAVVVLRYYEDLPEREVAELLGCSVGTVKSQTSKALARLRARACRRARDARERGDMERLEDDVRRVLTDRHHALPPNLVSLESIHVGARHRRRQRRLTAAGCVMAVALVAGSAALLGSGSAPGRRLDPATEPQHGRPTPTAAPADASPVVPVRPVPVATRAIDGAATSVTSFDAGQGVVVLGPRRVRRGLRAERRAGAVARRRAYVHSDARAGGDDRRLPRGSRGRGALPRREPRWLFGRGGLWSTHDGAKTWGQVELPGARTSNRANLPAHMIALEASGDRWWALTTPS
jgi:RNA polymerase sigma-70 factor (sigma-E family)